MKSIYGLLLILMATMLAVAQEPAQQEPFPSAPPEELQALRSRVDGFYTMFQQARFREAEGFVTEAGRDTFYSAPKTRIFSYEVKNIEFNPDLNSANVLVAAETVMPTPLSAHPVKQPLQSKWTRVDGQWYLDLKPVNSGDAYQTPAGAMHFNTETGKDGGRPGQFRPPNLASMQTMYELSNRNLRFNSEATDVETQTVTVKNKFQESLTIERETRDFPGMKIEVASEVVPKDGETTITFTYDPKLALLKGSKHFDFVLMPITQRVRVDIAFR